MPSLTLNRARTRLLHDIHAGRIYRSMGGCTLRQVRRGQNQRVDRRVRELADAGLVELGPDGRTYQLTATGCAALAEVSADA